MKKPKINVDWDLDEDYYRVNGEEVNLWEFLYVYKVMIDALLEYVNSKAGPTVAYNKAVEALKQAGCTDEK